MSLSTLDQNKWGANPIGAQAQRAEQAADKQGFFSNGSEPSFSDLVDTINPLHHLPVVNKIYEKASGDTIAPAAKIAGGFLMGGIFGAAAALATCIYDQAMGNENNNQMAQNDDKHRDEAAESELASLDPETMDELSPHHADTIEDVVDVAMPLDADDKAFSLASNTPPILSQAAAAVPLNPFRTLAQTAAAQAQAEGISAPLEVASISRTLWQRMEKIYGESQALEPLYGKLAEQSTLA